jgi:transposase-like protein
MDGVKLPKTLQEAIVYFADPDNALRFMVQFRWPDGKPVCPRCESTNSHFLATRRLWKCKACKKQFSAKSGTVLEDSPIPLQKWLPAIWMVCGCKNGISSYEISRDLGVTQKTAWFMLHRIREAMGIESPEKLQGEVEADETFVGGKLINMHRKSDRLKRANTDGNWGKTVVLGLLQRDGQVRAAVAPNRRRHHVEAHLTANLEPGSQLYTDNFVGYEDLPQFAREFIDHFETYVEGRVHTNGMENFWSLLKRTLKGTYVSVDPAHLQAYVDEQALRFNTRKDTDAERFTQVLSQVVGKRLTWDELTGRELDAQLN